MAIVENRGGDNGGPQNNPANISPLGGDGQSGQAKMYIPDMKSLGSTGVETMAQQNAASLSKAEVTPSGDMGSGLGMQLRGLFDDTQRTNEYISDGVDGTRGAGSSALPPSLASDQRPIENTALVQKYLPALMNAGRSVDAPDSYKKFLSYLMDQM